MSECGLIYGGELLDSLPLDGGCRQQLPSADDLRRVRKVSERTVAGYEVLLEHFRRRRILSDALVGGVRDLQRHIEVAVEEGKVLPPGLLVVVGAMHKVIEESHGRS